MARAVASSDDDDTDHATPALVVVASGRRFVRLRKQHGALIAKVRHKRSAIARLEAEAERIGRELATRTAPLRSEQRRCDDRAHGAFEAIVGDLQLSRSDRQTVRHLYQWLQSAGALTKAAHSFDASTLAATAEPARAATMRPTFLRLAREYHPDKTTDPTQHADRTEIMKELNHAYRGGDVSRLLELERTLDDGCNIAAPTDPITLETQVTALRAQLRGLSRQMSQLRREYSGAIAIEFRRLTDAGCADPIAALVGNVKLAVAQTRRLLDLIEQFRQGNIDLSQLLAGPASDDDDGWLTEVFAAARQSAQTGAGKHRRR